MSESLTLSMSELRELAFEKAFAQHRNTVYRWALRFGGGDATWAEDVTQETFVRFWRALPKLDEQQELAGWLYRVTANLALDRRRRERSFLGRLSALWAPEPEVPSVEVLHAHRHEANQALVTLRALGGPESVVLTMKVLDGLSQREIAQALSLSEGYVSKLLDRAWAKLRAAGWSGGER